MCILNSEMYFFLEMKNQLFNYYFVIICIMWQIFTIPIMYILLNCWYINFH